MRAGQTQTQESSTPKFSCRGRRAAELPGRLRLPVWSIQLALKSEGLACCETSGCPVLLGVLPSLHNGVPGTYPDDTAIGGQQGWKALVAVTGILEEEGSEASCTLEHSLGTHFAFGAQHLPSH